MMVLLGLCDMQRSLSTSVTVLFEKRVKTTRVNDAEDKYGAARFGDCGRFEWQTSLGGSCPELSRVGK